MTTSSNWFPIEPVPASRPRVRIIKTKDGRTFSSTYYAGKYKTFLADAEKAIPHAETTLEGDLHVSVLHYVTKPRTSKRTSPRGDVDNYVKGILDVLTKKGYWKDDDQIVSLYVAKLFVDPQDLEPKEAGIRVNITELPKRKFYLNHVVRSILRFFFNRVP